MIAVPAHVSTFELVKSEYNMKEYTVYFIQKLTDLQLSIILDSLEGIIDNVIVTVTPDDVVSTFVFDKSKT